MSDDRPVLYVEDEPLLREFAAVILEDAGFEVVTVKNGAAAFLALDDEREPFCAVVTDINLGDGPDGWAVAKHGRELNPELPVVYVTGANGYQWQSEGVPDSLLVKKPFTSAQIVEAIRSVLQHAHAAHNPDKAP
jgi:DNA-binding NtrC family response regulator